MRKAVWLAGLGVLMLATAEMTMFSASGARADVLKQATRELYAALKNACRQQGARLRVNWKKFETWVDITGDGEKDLIWHATPDAVSCGEANTGFCGTGGCSMLVVINRRKSFEFLAHEWTLGRLDDGTPLLVLGIHWAECNYADACQRILKWDPARERFVPIGLLYRPMRDDDD